MVNAGHLKFLIILVCIFTSLTIYEIINDNIVYNKLNTRLDTLYNKFELLSKDINTLSVFNY